MDQMSSNKDYLNDKFVNFHFHIFRQLKIDMDQIYLIKECKKKYFENVEEMKP